jgi:hypothetical protein
MTAANGDSGASLAATEWAEDDLLGAQSRSNASTPAVEEVPMAQRVFPDLEAWVTGWFVQVFARHPGPDRRWCSKWWDHPEAIHRLEDLWRSWEALRLRDDLGMSTWLREHLDPQRDRLMADAGPFQSCDKTEHNRPPDLPVVPAPEGWWRRTPEERRSYS